MVSAGLAGKYCLDVEPVILRSIYPVVVFPHISRYHFEFPAVQAILFRADIYIPGNTYTAGLPIRDSAAVCLDDNSLWVDNAGMAGDDEKTGNSGWLDENFQIEFKIFRSCC